MDTTEVSDGDLADQARAGGQRAFAELWRRHYEAGVRAARHCTSSLDADDLVSEAFTRIYRTMQAGGGPTTAFRPYLYTTIRNIAATWGAASHDITVDDFSEFEAEGDGQDPAAVALDRTLTARAFRSLPERWQSVLWYTEVEGMDPHEVAPLLGMSANGVAALSYRAREGLRKAWLQAHVSDATAAGECKWAIAKLGDRARHSLSTKDSERMDFHLATCTRCAIISEEVEEVGSHLASVLLPLTLGSAAGGTLLASLLSGAEPAATSVASVAPALLPPLPDVAGLGAAGAAGVGAAGASGVGVLVGPAAVVGSLAVAFTLVGTAVIVAPDSTASSSSSSESGTSDGAGADSTGESDAADPSDTGRGDPANIPDLGDIGGEAGSGGLGTSEQLEDLSDSLIDTITGDETAPEGHTAPGGVVGTDINLNLIGTATPGAHLSLQALGQVYATTTVAADGTFVLNATAIPGGLSSLELVQEVDRAYLATLLPGGGVLEKTLGTLDSLVNALIRPIQLGSGGGQVNIVLVG